tara:strand:- start:2713 stop:2865 length:153 start_codon:yes stop_codon:yes gene_type:complete
MSKASHEGMFSRLHIAIEIGEVYDPGEVCLMKLNPAAVLIAVIFGILPHG